MGSTGMHDPPPPRALAQAPPAAATLRRVKRLPLLAALLVLLGVPGAAAAQDTYTVHHCRSPAGTGATTEGLSAISAYAVLGDACPAGGVVSGPPTATFTTLQGFGIRYRVPADTRLAGYVLYRTVSVPPQWNWTLFRDADSTAESDVAERCWNMAGACAGRGDGTVSTASRIAGTAPDSGGLLLYVDCNPGDCPAGGGARVVLHRLDAQLSDRLDPTFVGTPSGDLLVPGQAVAGTRSVAFSAADRGGGVYRATLEVDGTAAVTQVVDENGGRCREPFTEPVPCRLTASGSIALDTASLPDGVHSVRLLVSDATGTNTVVHGPVRITTRNQAPGCDPTITPAVTPVTLRFRGTRSRHLTRRGGRGARVAGTVAGAGAGTTVFLIGRAVRAGARDRVVARALTAADGSFRLRVPRGVSRRLRAGHRVRPTDPLLACSRPLELRTPARARLRARSLPGRVRLSGRLLGGHVPARGKTVELQAFERGRWRTFESVRANRRGRFRAGYRFSASSIGRVFRMRARVRPEATYPFALGHSPVIRVRVA
jgi:hypothetical protein